jgi:hypothetical protein
MALLASLPAEADWHLALEFPLLRLGRRINAVLLTDRAIFVIGLRMGATQFHAADRVHIEDAALDLMDFHAGSQQHPIVPLLVAGEAPDARVQQNLQWPLLWHRVSAPVICCNAALLGAMLSEIQRRIGRPAQRLDALAWQAAVYAPVPTIVEAARMLFARNDVADIMTARADATNLRRTGAVIAAAIAQARAQNRHVVVFVTGVPGAGKTLCGLHAVFGSGMASAFLTGNLPLVFVLREALARDAAQAGRSLRMARQQTEAAIQPLMGFLRDNTDRTNVPHERVIVFDEAQRAWNAAFGRRKVGRDDSEAALCLDIMRRHEDHAVIIALVGSGQEISTGEAGLAEWGRALSARPEWLIVAPPGVFSADEPRERLLGSVPATARLEPALHLDIPIRSIRSPVSAAWVDAVLRSDPAGAAAMATQPMPFFVTRSLAQMRAALRRLARGTRRAGLLCSAAAQRLRAEGISPEFAHLEDDVVANWFLNRWPDVRASDALEVPANQFACQGLELDLVGLCWGGDLVRARGKTWLARCFRGTRWNEHRSPDKIAYQINTYRVLLTRARYETIIWVPEGSANDATRDPVMMNDIADYLLCCGARKLAIPQSKVDIPPPQPQLL